MRISTAFVIVLVLLTSFVMVNAQGAPPPPAPIMPAMPTGLPGMRSLAVGPTDSKGMPRKVGGKISILGIAPKDSVMLSEVEIYVDGNIIGRADKAPYRVEFDTASVTDGEHVVKAVGKDTDGKEAWSATTKAIINNSGKPNGAPTQLPAAPSVPANPTPGVGANNAPPPSVPLMQPNQNPNPASPDLTNTYTNNKYRFSLQYPSNWVVEDATAKMKPKSAGGFWLVFGEKPVNKASMVVNLRRMKLAPTTDADVFAEYNSYVNKWERKTIINAPAFTTTGGSPESKRVVHRAIIITNGSAWMFNCIDTTGKPAQESARLFETMINSLVLQ